MTQWIPWQPGQAVEEWASKTCLVSFKESDRAFSARYDDLMGCWRWAESDVDTLNVVVAYAKMPSAYKPVVGIAVGQVRRTDLAVEVTVLNMHPMNGPRNWVCEIPIGERLSFRNVVQEVVLLTWPVVRVEQDDDK